jgi:hypothetical protein
MSLVFPDAASPSRMIFSLESESVFCNDINFFVFDITV